MMPKSEAARYAEDHPDILKVLPSGKLHFIETGMDFPSTTTKQILESYVNGKAYRRAKLKKQNEDYDFTKHLPYIVPHKHRNEKHFLYCILTGATLARDKHVVETHISAKKFKRKLMEDKKRKEDRRKSIEKRKQKSNSSKDKNKDKEETNQEDSRMEDVEENENQNGDVLDGILTDEDEDEQSGSGSEIEDDDDNNNEKLNQRMTEDDDVDKNDVFWTRGNKQAIDSENENTDDEWGESSNKTVKEQKQALDSEPSTEIIKASKVKKTGKRTSPAKSIKGKRQREGVSVPRRAKQLRKRKMKSETAT